MLLPPRQSLEPMAAPMQPKCKDCTRQVDSVQADLQNAQRNGEVSPDWSFTPQPWIPLPFIGDWHTVLHAKSSSPIMPSYTLDPWFGVTLQTSSPFNRGNWGH